MERCNRKLSELELKKQYQINISNIFATLENLNDNGYIKRAWEIKSISKPRLKSV